MDNLDRTSDELANAKPTEDRFTKNIEKVTAAMPSSAYLGVAVGAMAVSLALHITGRGKWGNFIAQWGPTRLDRARKLVPFPGSLLYSI